MARGTCPPPERVRASVAAAILGIEIRTVQALAAQGELPGAAKIGRLWTFDETALRRWIKERSACPKDQRPPRIRTGVEIRYGRGSPLQASNIEKAYEQALQKLRQSASQK